MSIASFFPPATDHIPRRHFTWYGEDIVKIYLYLMLIAVGVLALPHGLGHAHRAFFVVGTIGVWRYGWWFLNLWRSRQFVHHTYPKMSARADALWHSGWRPHHVHILMITYHEKRRLTEAFLSAVVKEMRRDNLKGTLWVCGAEEDERVVTSWMEATQYSALDVMLVRQPPSGKRVAIGTALRAMSRRGVHSDDVAFLMDGDSIMDQNAMRKCSAMLGAYPALGAVTTDEDAVVAKGPRWMTLWLHMRFAQRRIMMQSHALSGKVLTLTGRMSAFRAHYLVEKEFIHTIENDTLEHWLWGRFRFLSGDDKSTWYALLKRGVDMTYLPDVLVYTVEHIEGNPYVRAMQNMQRWSGNMLRNGMRAIQLGPRRVTPFIWWCLIDQRLSIWTLIAGLMAAVLIALSGYPAFLLAYMLWVLLSRFLMSIALWKHTDRVYISWPLLLYASQVTASLIKMYVLFRLPKQRWTNRRNQKGDAGVMANPWRRLQAHWVHGLYLLALLLAVLLSTGIFHWPPAHGAAL